MDRSYLFVPGNQPERIQKAILSDTDAVIVDLEDSVPIQKKAVAREQVVSALQELGPVTKPIYIRINDRLTPFWNDDLEILKMYPFAGVVLPKADSGDDIHILEKYLPEEMHIIPLIETARGVLAVQNIAASSNRVKRIAFGAIDFCLELGISPTPNQEALLYPRSIIAIASAAYYLGAPIDTVYTDLHNEDGLMEEANRAKQLGFQAKLCIHPMQTKIINGIFSPAKEEVTWAIEVVVAFEKAELEGSAAIQLNGKMVDYPVYKQAIQILERTKTIPRD